MRALVADDYPGIVEVHAEILMRLGFEVTEAGWGRAALELARGGAASSDPFDLLLLDHSMPPGPTGLQILRDMRANGDDTPVLIVTGSDSVGGPMPANSMLLRKPVKAQHVELAVRMLLPDLEAIS